jgi:hypothetical protein
MLDALSAGHAQGVVLAPTGGTVADTGPSIPHAADGTGGSDATSCAMARARRTRRRSCGAGRSAVTLCRAPARPSGSFL